MLRRPMRGVCSELLTTSNILRFRKTGFIRYNRTLDSGSRARRACRITPAAACQILAQFGEEGRPEPVSNDEFCGLCRGAGIRVRSQDRAPRLEGAIPSMAQKGG